MSTPRFTDEHLVPLRRAMFDRQPTFKLIPGDVDALVQETGLNKAQILKWADNFRGRVASKQLDDVLANLRGNQSAGRVRAKRFFVSCFEVTPDFAVKFEYQKGEIPIKYMEAGFNKDQQSGDFFVEFEEQIHDNELELSFQAQHAKGVNVMTFPNDNGKSASDALLHVMAVQDKYGVKITRGVFPASLKKSFEAQKAAQDKKVLEQEFNEKTQAAEKASLDEFKSKLGEVHDEVQGLGHFQQGIKDDVLSIGNNVQSYGVKMEAGFEGVKQEVLSFIPDFQERVKQLEKEVEYHKAQRDIQEGKTAAQTTKLNKLKEVVTNRDDEIAALVKREEAHVKREEGLLARIKEVENAIHVSKLISSTVQKLNELIQLAQEDRAFARAERAELKQSIAEVQETAKTLGDMLSMEEERAAKRPRA